MAMPNRMGQRLQGGVVIPFAIEHIGCLLHMARIVIVFVLEDDGLGHVLKKWLTPIVPTELPSTILF